MNDPTMMPPPERQPAPPAPPAAGESPGIRARLIPGSDQTEGEVPASPEDEAVLDQVVSKAMMMIHGTKSREAVVKTLHNPREDASVIVGRTAANILMTIGDQYQASTKQPMDPDILTEAASYVIPGLVEVGVAAGIFPFELPGDDSPEEVGQGDSDYDEVVRMALLEATKVYGEAELRKPGAEGKTEEAGNEWARQVSSEVQNGTADPEFMKIARPQQQLIPEGA